MNPDDSRSLIAFVQKHKLSVDYHSNCWAVKEWRPNHGGMHCHTGKTWTAAVRKAKRVIEGGKK